MVLGHYFFDRALDLILAQRVVGDGGVLCSGFVPRMVCFGLDIFLCRRELAFFLID